MAGHMYNLREGIVSLVYPKGVSAPREQRFVSLTVTIYVAVCTWVLPVAFDFLPSAFVAGSGDAPTLLHWQEDLRGLSRGGQAPSDRGYCVGGALVLRLPLRFRLDRFILIFIF